MPTTVALILLAIGFYHRADATEIGTHAKIGALLGKQCDNEWEALLAGLASHAALDYLVYGSVNELSDSGNSSYLAPTLALNVLQLRQVYRQYRKTKDKNLLYGTLGALLPDVADAVYHHLLDNEGYVFGWHGRRSTLLVDERPSPASNRKSARWNVLIGAAVWSARF